MNEEEEAIISMEHLGLLLALFSSSMFHFPQTNEQLPLTSKPAPGEKIAMRSEGSVGGGPDL